MTRAAMAALLSHWRRQPGQLATLLIGLALATALWSAVQAINAEARASYDQAAGMLDARALARLSGPMDRDTYVALRRGGWNVSPVLEGRRVFGDQRLTITGIDPVTAPAQSLPGLTAPDTFDAPASENAQIAPTGFLTGEGLGFVAPSTLQRLQGVAGLPPLRAAPELPPNRLLTDISVAERLLATPGALSRIIVLPEQPVTRLPLETLAPGLTLTPAQDQSDVSRLTDSFHLNLTAFGLLSFAVGLFIVHAAIGLAFEQRRPMLRTLRALGLPLRHLLALLLAELVLLSLLAGALGVLAGYFIAALLLPDVAATLDGLYGAAVPGTLAFRPLWALAGLGIAVAGTLTAAASGLNKVRRMPLLASAQPRAWARASTRALILQGLAGAGLLLVGGTWALLGTGLVAGFALLAGLLMGAALMLPAALALALSLGARLARGPVAQWFWADTRQQLPGLSLALMALLLALATNIGVSTMVSSFRQTFTGWLDQRLASELYVTARTNAEAARLTQWLTPRVDAILPIWSTEAQLGGSPGQIYGIIDHATYRDNWPLLEAVPQVWDAVTAGDAALINEQLARRLHLSPGDEIALGPNWTAPIAGIYSDYGNPSGQAIVGLDQLTSRFPALPRLRYGLRLAPDKAPALARALTDEFGLPDTSVVDQASIKAFSLDVFDRTFTVTAALNILTLSVAGFAILTSLLTLSTMRLPQLAPVWALGLTRTELSRLEVLRSLALALLVFLLALPLGLGLAWALLDVVNVAAFGWKLPMQIFPSQWIWLLGAALAAALFASALPVRRLRRTPPGTFLMVFANEG